MVVPEHEAVSAPEMREALFRHIAEWQRDRPQPGDYVGWVYMPHKPKP